MRGVVGHPVGVVEGVVAESVRGFELEDGQEAPVGVAEAVAVQGVVGCHVDARHQHRRAQQILRHDRDTAAERALVHVHKRRRPAVEVPEIPFRIFADGQSGAAFGGQVDCAALLPRQRVGCGQHGAWRRGRVHGLPGRADQGVALRGVVAVNQRVAPRAGECRPEPCRRQLLRLPSSALVDSIYIVDAGGRRREVDESAVGPQPLDGCLRRRRQVRPQAGGGVERGDALAVGVEQDGEQTPAGGMPCGRQDALVVRRADAAEASAPDGQHQNALQAAAVGLDGGYDGAVGADGRCRQTCAPCQPPALAGLQVHQHQVLPRAVLPPQVVLKFAPHHRVAADAVGLVGAAAVAQQGGFGAVGADGHEARRDVRSAFLGHRQPAPRSGEGVACIVGSGGRERAEGADGECRVLRCPQLPPSVHGLGIEPALAEAGASLQRRVHRPSPPQTGQGVAPDVGAVADADVGYQQVSHVVVIGDVVGVGAEVGLAVVVDAFFERLCAHLLLKGGVAPAAGPCVSRLGRHGVALEQPQRRAQAHHDAHGLLPQQPRRATRQSLPQARRLRHVPVFVPGQMVEPHRAAHALRRGGVELHARRRPRDEPVGILRARVQDDVDARRAEQQRARVPAGHRVDDAGQPQRLTLHGPVEHDAASGRGYLHPLRVVRVGAGGVVLRPGRQSRCQQGRCADFETVEFHSSSLVLICDIMSGLVCYLCH